MTATGLVCSSCGIELPQNAKFCLECGAAVSTAAKPAEYKQVTVLFADVVHSMNIASAVGAERLREIMAQLVDRAAAVVKRYGGMVDKFTGDGIMAIFGAPVALEDHALRACMAALEDSWPHQRSGSGGVPPRWCRTSAADRVELRAGDHRGDRRGCNGLHRRRRASRYGAADGIGGPAGWGDAQRIHCTTG